MRCARCSICGWRLRWRCVRRWPTAISVSGPAFVYISQHAGSHRMSVLETPRILFRGQIAWDPIVTNNRNDVLQREQRRDRAVRRRLDPAAGRDFRQAGDRRGRLAAATGTRTAPTARTSSIPRVTRGRHRQRPRHQRPVRRRAGRFRRHAGRCRALRQRQLAALLRHHGLRYLRAAAGSAASAAPGWSRATSTSPATPTTR